jgi:hypothetical protein
MQHPRDDQPDDLDRLFARLQEVPPPADFADRVLARTARVEQVSPMRARVTLGIYLVTLVMLGVAAYRAGQGMSLSGAGDLLQLLLSDPAMLVEEPSAFLLGIGELLPWWDLGFALVLAVASLVAVRALGRFWTAREDVGMADAPETL